MSEITVDGERVDTETGVVLGLDANGKGTLFGKLAKVMGKLERVPKNGWNDFNNYAYATESDVADALRPLLAEHGIGLVVAVEDVAELENCRTLVRLRITLGDESGETLDTVVYGEARDADSKGNRQDKGLYKAITGAMKYWMFKTFLISTGDDPEDDAGNRPQRERKEKARPTSTRKGKPLQYKPDAPATEKQKNFLRVLIKDEHITDAERKQLEKALDKGMTRDVISKAISRTQDKIKEREGEAPEAQAEPNGGSSEAESEAPPPDEERERKEAFVAWEKLWRSYPKLGGAADRQVFEARVLKARGDLFHRGKGTIDHTKLTPADYGKLAETLTDELTGEGFFTEEEAAAATGASDA